MTVELIELIATQGVFRPRGHFSQLAVDHVPFDLLLGQESFETAARRAVIGDDTAVGVLGPRGAGKSSLIAHVCAHLPETHLALRVPVTGADDPTSISVVAAVALSQALDDIELERYQRETLERARSDTSTQQRSPGGLRSGTLGGGAIPVQVHAELTSLREDLTANRLAAERLAGLERLITILVARDLQPVFVLEDTEAAVGGAEQTDIASAFLAGPVHAFVHEVQAPCLVAIQDAFCASDAFAHLAASMRLIEIPVLDENHARDALVAIIANRLRQHDVSDDATAVITEGALVQLVAFYDETDRSLRFMLAALQSAAEYAADMRAQRIADGHVRAAIADWRARISG